MEGGGGVSYLLDTWVFVFGEFIQILICKTVYVCLHGGPRIVELFI